MGCGSSTATGTAAQPAPKLKSTSSRSSLKESNGHAKKSKDSDQSGERNSVNQKRGDEEPPPEANGHVPVDSDSHIDTGNKNQTSETTSGSVEPEPVEENINNGSIATEEKTTLENKESSTQQEQFNGEEASPGEVAANPQETASKHNTSQGKVSVSEELPAVIASSSSVGDDEKKETNQEKDVSEAQDFSVVGDAETAPLKDTSEISLSGPKNTSKTSLSGDKDMASHNNTGEVPSHNDTSHVSLSSDKDTVQEQNNTGEVPSHNDTSHVSLSSDKDTVQEQNNRKGSMTVSEYFGAPSDEEISLSRQSVGASQPNILPPTAEHVQPSEPIETVKEDSASLGGREETVDQTIEVSGGTYPASSSQESTANDEGSEGRLCTVTANVRIGSLEDPLGQRTVTLTGSVYRVPREEGDPITPNPGDKIGIVKGDVTSTPVDNGLGEKLATLSGDLFAVSGEALANGHIATASIDVLSCNSGEKIATITADVAPSDDLEHQSGVITGDVLAMSDKGSYDDKIGSLSGKVVALTFDEDLISLTSVED